MRQRPPPPQDFPRSLKASAYDRVVRGDVFSFSTSVSAWCILACTSTTFAMSLDSYLKHPGCLPLALFSQIAFIDKF